MKQRIAPSASTMKPSWSQVSLLTRLRTKWAPSQRPMREGRHRAQRQPDGGVEKPQPLAEEIAAQEAGGLAGNGRDDHLQRLEHDEEHGREEAPLLERLLEEPLVVVEADEERYDGRVGADEPRAVPR